MPPYWCSQVRTRGVGLEVMTYQMHDSSLWPWPWVIGQRGTAILLMMSGQTDGRFMHGPRCFIINLKLFCLVGCAKGAHFLPRPIPCLSQLRPLPYFVHGRTMCTQPVPFERSRRHTYVIHSHAFWMYFLKTLRGCFYTFCSSRNLFVWRRMVIV